MIYPFSLFQVGILVGLVLLLAHLAAFVVPGQTCRMLRAFPRSRSAATALLAIAAVWSFWLVATIDLGEFTPMRRYLMIGVPVGAVLSWLYVDEFLSVRALGILALLAAEPILGAAFLRDETSRLFIVSLAYVWIIASLFLVGMPYVLRDLITWLTTKPRIFRVASLGGIAYGILLLVCSVVFWRA